MCWPAVPDRLVDAEEATRLWKEVVACIELGVLSLHDLQGKDADKFKGRAMGNMWQVRPCKVQCAPHRVATAMQGRAWRW